MSLNNMARDCHNISESKGWLEETRSFGDLISLMHSELSEALEEFRDKRGFQEVYYRCDDCETEYPLDYVTGLISAKTPCCYAEFKPEGIPIELADVMIRILQFCGTYEVDIEKAYDLKMKFNATRPYKHGGKLI